LENPADVTKKIEFTKIDLSRLPQGLGSKSFDAKACFLHGLHDLLSYLCF